jgi:hypothetical protein
MTDQPYPPEWLDEAPAEPPWLDAMDPRSGEFLEPWKPTPAESALVKELALQHVAGTPEFNAGFLRFCSDRYRDRSWPQAMLAMLEAFKIVAIGSQGLDLSVARLREDVRVARAEALDEMR